MTATFQESRFEFAPPQAPGRWSAFALAVGAHALLILALTFSVQWRHQTETPAIAAELWSKLPEVAAPKLEEPPTPIPEVKPVEPPTPALPTPLPPPAPPKPQVAPPPPLPSAADIALEREKQKKIAEDRRRQELLLLQKQEQKLAKEKAEKAEKAKLERELAEREKLEKEKLAKAQRDKLAKLEQERLEKQQKKETERKAEEKRQAEARELEKQKKAQKDQEEKAKLAAEAKAKSAAEAKALEAQRQQNLKRMAGLAGANGEATSTGTALRSSGPSANYTGRIIAKVKPNIVFADDISGNPVAEVEVRTAPDGTIVGRKLVKSSGNKAWDEAVLKALDKTEILPRDEGRPPPSPMVIAFRPRD